MLPRNVLEKMKKRRLTNLHEEGDSRAESNKSACLHTEGKRVK